MNAPRHARFEEGLYGFDVIVLWRFVDGWQISTVLQRGPGGQVFPVEPWSAAPGFAAEGSWGGEWQYLSAKLRDGTGGNGTTYEVDGFSVESLADIPEVLRIRAAADSGPATSRSEPFGRGGEETASWDDDRWRIKSDSTRTAAYRRLQGWFREVHLGVTEVGIGHNGRPVASMLPIAEVLATPGLNFLTPAAADHAEERIAAAHAEDAALAPDRLRRNMLSSMPLCFNIFGAIGTHPAFTRVVQRLFDPAAHTVLEVVCEWAPRPRQAYLDDRSAFDAVILYLDREGRRCAIGVETKYTEPFSPAEYRSARYDSITRTSGWFREGAAETLADSTTNQLWRTLMLAAALQMCGDVDRARVVVLTLDDDAAAHRAVEAASDWLTDSESLQHVTYTQLVESVRAVDDPELEAWADRFATRYLLPETPPDVWPCRVEPMRVGLQAPQRRYEPDHAPSVRIVESLSWAVAAAFTDLVGGVALTEEHPADGSYDCLTIRPTAAQHDWECIQLNRHGSGHVFGKNGRCWSWQGMWAELAATHDVDFAARLLMHHAGNRPVDAATSRNSGVALISTALLARLWSRETWSCAYLFDTTTFDGTPRPSWVPRHSARCWLLRRDDVPVMAIDTDNAAAVLGDGPACGDTIDLHVGFDDAVSALESLGA